MIQELYEAIYTHNICPGNTQGSTLNYISKFLLYNVKKANPRTSHILSFIIFEPGGPWT
jgi:hypothetical protein